MGAHFLHLSQLTKRKDTAGQTRCVHTKISILSLYTKLFIEFVCLASVVNVILLFVICYFKPYFLGLNGKKVKEGSVKN